MKRFLSIFVTLIFALACNYFTKTLYFDFLNSKFPDYITKLIAVASVLVLCIIWISLILRIKLKAFKLGKQKVSWIWILSAILIPAIFVLIMSFMHCHLSFGKINFTAFARTVLIALAADVLINELTFRTLILNDFENLCGKFLACFFTSLLYACISVRNYKTGILPILQQISMPFVFSMLLSLMAFHTESIISGVIFSFIIKVADFLVYTGSGKSDTALLCIETDLNPWILIAIKAGIFFLFIIIAVLLLAKKKKEEVLYW